MKSLELKVPPLILAIAFALIMYGVALLLPAADLTIDARTSVAIVFAGLGALIVAAGIVAFRRHKTTANPMAPEQAATVVVDGIYRFTRNPMYLGFVLMLAGWAVYLANAGAVLLVPGFVFWMTEWQIKPEERALAIRFGAEYAEYVDAVRRWI